MRVARRLPAKLASIVSAVTVSSTVMAAPTPAIAPKGARDASWVEFSGANAGATVGFTFTVGKRDLAVTSLGVFQGTGLTGSHEVGIWDDAGTLLGSVTVKAGAESTLDGEYRYESLTVTLAKNQTYTVGAFFPGMSTERILVVASDSTVPHLTFGGSRQTSLILGGGSFARPTIDAKVAQGVFGPGFRYEGHAAGGAISGLTNDGLVLRIDDATDLPIAASGPYRFEGLPDGTYDVTVKSQPAGQHCSFAATGTVVVAGGDVTNLDMTCGLVPTDAGSDSGVDAGPEDAGAGDEDSGVTDAGAPDSTTPEPVVPAADSGATAPPGSSGGLNPGVITVGAADSGSGCSVVPAESLRPASLFGGGLVAAACILRSLRRRRSAVALPATQRGGGGPRRDALSTRERRGRGRS
ncbi:MAG: DUF4082 domain-containing protein [Labilithrix sp.]|nr:DUF4082 domain-containing protein [Labilithrix sp.]MCW5811696.1 DUF4082 domain-containing protein [Labilithrix sp.]